MGVGLSFDGHISVNKDQKIARGIMGHTVFCALPDPGQFQPLYSGVVFRDSVFCKVL